MNRKISPQQRPGDALRLLSWSWGRQSTLTAKMLLWGLIQAGEQPQVLTGMWALRPMQVMISSSWKILNSESPKWQFRESCWCCAIDVLGVLSGNTLFPPLSNHQADLGSAAGQKTIAREADNFKMNEISLQPALKKIKKGTFFFYQSQNVLISWAML